MKKCTCILGHFLCPEAVRLWDMVNAAYRAKDWKEYELAKKRYSEHIDGVNR